MSLEEIQEQLKALRKKWLAGEISKAEHDAIREELLSELTPEERAQVAPTGTGKTPVTPMGARPAPVQGTVTPTLTAGVVLQGRYKIERPLGSGGQADVYLAEDSHSGDKRVLKVLKAGMDFDASRLETIRKEFRRLSRLAHRHICRVFDLGRDGEYEFLVMEYVEGKSLRQLLNEKGKLEEPEALKIAGEVLEGLAEAHGEGIFHLDVKPENVLIEGKTGRAKLIDFGISVDVTRSQVAGGWEGKKFMGTPFYMAPERIRGEALSGKVDVYSTGILLYEMLTGRPPFNDPDPDTVRYQHQHVAVKTPEGMKEDLGELLQAFVAKETAGRPDAVEALAILKEWTADGGKKKKAKALQGEVGKLLETGELKSAHEAITRLKALDPESAESYAIRLQTMTMIMEWKGKVEKALKKGDLEGAEGAVEALRELDAEAAEGYEEKLEGLREQREEERRQEAIQALEREVEAAIDRKQYEAALGTARRLEGHDRAKGKQYQKRIEILIRQARDPNLPPEDQRDGIRKNEKGYYEKEFKNGHIMIWVPPGEFMMGSDEERDEKPVHKVTFQKGFWLDKYPVTNKQFLAYARAAGKEQEFIERNEGTLGALKGNYLKDYPNHPVVKVDWNAARAYARWAGLRLPSEAEWEYAARSRDGRQYPWGDAEPIPGLANYDMDPGHPTEVGNYPSGMGPHGHLDLAGNVWEWCEDKWHDNYKGAPADGRAWVAGSSEDRVLRGGSWFSSPRYLRVSDRGWLGPGVRSGSGGFRCAQDR